MPTPEPNLGSAREDPQWARLLAEWGSLTYLEWQAIQAECWSELENRQRAKARLAADIQTILKGEPGGDSGVARNTPCQPAGGLTALVADIMRAEARNRDLLQTKLEQRRLALQEVNQDANSLQSLRRAYAPQPPHHWQSYS